MLEAENIAGLPSRKLHKHTSLFITLEKLFKILSGQRGGGRGYNRIVQRLDWFQVISFLKNRTLLFDLGRNSFRAKIIAGTLRACGRLIPFRSSAHARR